jgi:hypothetical protein
MRWKKERPVPPPTAAQKELDAALRLHERQRILLILGTGAVVIMATVVAMRLAVPRTLPGEVRGVWRTDAARYQRSHFELRRGLVVFLEGDSSASPTAYTVTRVWQRRSEGGTLYQVQYEENGEALLFSFVYLAGPPERILFANQRGLVWTKIAGATLMPNLY